MRIKIKKVIQLLLAASLTFFGPNLYTKDEGLINKSLPPRITQANPEFIYKFLLAEIAAQRDELNTAGHLFLDLAKRTLNVTLAERATRLASDARNGRLALDSAKVWNILAPQSINAQQILAELFIASGNLSSARPIIKKILDQDKVRSEGFLYLNNILTKVINKQNALRFIKEIAEPYPNSKEAHFAIAHAAYFADKKDLAIKELDTIEHLDPKWESAILFRGYIIGKEWPEKAIAYYQEYLTRHPNSNEIRLEYAKILTSLKQYNAAKKEFLTIVNSSIASSKLSLTVALLAMELEDNVLAEKYLIQSLKRGHPQPDQIYIYLARIYDLRNNHQGALSWLGKITSGEFFLQAKIITAQMIARRQSVDEAIEQLNHYKYLSASDQLILLQTKVSFLYNDQRANEAYDLMREEEENFIDSAEFKFDYAILAEKMGNIIIMEQLLKEAIKLKPDYAIAYNALGYSYADRNIKLYEAKRNIEIALSIQPNNHYILDSMGWVHYRLGNIEIASKFLKKAYAIQKDPEIAAHLGEVLWQQKMIKEASELWQASLRNNPSNRILLDTINKYR